MCGHIIYTILSGVAFLRQGEIINVRWRRLLNPFFSTARYKRDYEEFRIIIEPKRIRPRSKITNTFSTRYHIIIIINRLGHIVVHIKTDDFHIV